MAVNTEIFLQQLYTIVKERGYQDIIVDLTTGKTLEQLIQEIQTSKGDFDKIEIIKTLKEIFGDANFTDDGKGNIHYVGGSVSASPMVGINPIPSVPSSGMPTSSSPGTTQPTGTIPSSSQPATSSPTSPITKTPQELAAEKALADLLVAKNEAKKLLPNSQEQQLITNATTIVEVDNIKKIIQQRKADELAKLGVQARIEQEWSDFFTLHNINQSNEATWKTNASASDAELIYTNAKNQDSSYTSAEKDLIDKVQIPNDLPIIQQTIITTRIENAWNNFFATHNITDNPNKTFWKGKYHDDYLAAEKEYSDALAFETYTTNEKDLLINAKNTTEIEEIQENIPWERFFTQENITNKDDWKLNSGLNLSEVQTAYSNGWNNKTEKIINRKIANYQGEEIDVLTVKKTELDKVNQLIEIISKETDINKLNTLDIKDYQEAWVPNQKNYQTIKTLWEKKIEQIWNNFFTNNSITDGTVWKTNLTFDEAQVVHGNGWDNLTNNITNLNNQQVSYNHNGKTTNNIELLNHNRNDIEQAHHLIKSIEQETSVSNLPTDSIIQSKYQESKVPTSLNYNTLKDIRLQKTKELFEKAFEGTNPTNQPNIDLWRTENTGLVKNGLEERQVFDNGWTNPSEINNKVTKYLGISVKVLTIKKADIDNEIKTYDALFADISKQISLHDIIPTYKQSEIDNLNYDLLPVDKQKNHLEDKRTQIRDNLWFNLTSVDPRDGGIETSLLTLAEQEEQTNSWTIKTYNKLTPEIANNFLATCEGVKVSLDPAANNGERDINQDLKDLDGFEIDEIEPGISKKEDALPKKTKGIYQLPLFYKMNNYDKDVPDFCQWEDVDVEIEVDDTKKPPITPEKIDPKTKKKIPAVYAKLKKVVKRKIVIDTTLEDDLNDPANPRGYIAAAKQYLQKKYFVNGKLALKGHLAIGTGVGKTTKTINCLLYMMRKLFGVNVILVCPTAELVQSAYNHHSGWLQDWGCVVHQEKETFVDIDGTTQERYKSHGKYNVEMNKLVKDGLSIMEPKYLDAYLARTLVDVSKLDSKMGGKTQTPAEKTAFEEAVKKIKDEVIPDGTLIVFDEADFAISEWQELIRDTIFLTDEHNQAKFRVLKMSATFKGKPFSITSSYPGESYYMTGLSSGTPLQLEKQMADGNTLIILKSIKERKDEKGNIVGGFGRKQLEVLEKANVFHVVADEIYQPYIEGISEGLPNGSVIVGDTIIERGFTLKIRNAISSGLIQMSSLGEFCRFSKPHTQSFTVASGVQQKGRVRRIDWGLWITLSMNFEEVKITADLISDMVKAIVSGVTSVRLKGLGSSFADVNFIRAGVALYHVMKNKAAAPEELLVGLQGLPEYPTFRTDYPSWNPDKNLWARYKGEPEPDALVWDQDRIDRSKDILKLMIKTSITNDKDFPNKLNVEMKTFLLEKVSMTEAEAREVLNALIVQKIKEIEDNDNTYDKVNKRGKVVSTIKQIADLHRVVLPADKGGTKITMGLEKDRDGKEFYVLRMKYNTI